MAQELPKVFCVGDKAPRHLLCFWDCTALSSAAHRQVGNLVRLGLCLPPASSWQSAWVRGQEGTQLWHRIWPLCRDEHLSEPLDAAAVRLSAKSSSFCTEEPPDNLTFSPPLSLAAEGRNVQD